MNHVHVYTNNTNMVSDVDVITFGKSDHKTIFCTLSCKVSKHRKNDHTSVEYRSLKNFNACAFFSDLNEAPFDSVYNEINAERAFDQFVSFLFQQSCLPFVEKGCKSSNLTEEKDNFLNISIYSVIDI